MSGKTNLILVVSEAMDNNKKEGRNEHNLVRMSAKVRDFMGFKEDSVELWDGSTDKTRLKSATVLNIFKAFSKDIAKARRMVDEKKISAEDLERVGFVTSRTYKRIMGDTDSHSAKIWVTNGVEDIMMGADPEFLLFDGERVQKANMLNQLSLKSLIGCDGAMAEVRPAPATTPEGLVENIRAVFKDDTYVGPIKKYDWRSGVYHKDHQRDYPIGGHIHLGNPAKIARMAVGKRESFFRVLNKILDELIAVPLMRLDGKEGNHRRVACVMGKYGYFGEYRLCNGRLEHRTLSGKWLSHPKLAECVFGVTRAVVEEVYQHVANNNFDMQYMCPNGFQHKEILKPHFSSWKDIPLAADMQCLTTSADMKTILNKCDTRFVNKLYLARWYNLMRSMSTYKKYGVYVDALLDLLSRPVKELRTLDMCIKSNWLEGKKFKLTI